MSRCWLGMVMVVSREHLNERMEELKKAGERVLDVGRLVEREKECGHFAFTHTHNHTPCIDTQDDFCQQQALAIQRDQGA